MNSTFSRFCIHRAESPIVAASGCPSTSFSPVPSAAVSRFRASKILRLGLSTYSPNWYISYRQLGLPESIGVESPFGTRELLEEASPDLILPDAGHLSGRFGPR